MAHATVGLGAVMGLGLAIPIGRGLVPETGAGQKSWTTLDRSGWRQLQASTDAAVQIDFNKTLKDAYVEESSQQSVWGIRVPDLRKFMRDRADLFTADGTSKLPYEIVTLGFVLFSPLCPHLNCPYSYDVAAKKFKCPCHGSQYDQSGARIAGPAARGLDPLPLRERSGTAQIEWIRYQATSPDRIIVSYIG